MSKNCCPSQNWLAGAQTGETVFFTWIVFQSREHRDRVNAKVMALNEMERTGGEPDVVGHDKKTGEYIFFDCSAESPKGRKSVCFDREGLPSDIRKLGGALFCDHRFGHVFVYHNGAQSYCSARAR